MTTKKWRIRDMRKSLFVLVAAMTVITAVPALAELQNVEVGGSLRIRGNWYSQVASVVPVSRGIIPPSTAAGGFSTVAFDDEEPDALYVEQRTRLNVKADFTDDVSAFIELDSYNNWGDESGFRRPAAADTFDNFVESESQTPASRAISGSSLSTSGTNVNFYQGYIQMNEAWGYPITLKMGRSEMIHGSEFLVGNQDTSSGFIGLSFDGIWGTYTHDSFWVQAFWTRLVQNNNGGTRWESSGDVDFMGLYGSYTGIEDMTIDGYYYYLHQAVTDINEAPLGLQEESSGLHTVGARFAGNKAGFDWEANGAYQFGDNGAADPNSDDFSAFAAQGAFGYTFDIEFAPRVFINAGYYDSDDEDPAFRRLFSDHEYSEFLDAGDLSNMWFVGGGAGAQITEAIGLTAVVNWFNAVEDYGNSDEDLGLEIGLYATYAYSEDLTFSAGWAHLFVGDGLDPDLAGGESPLPLANSGRTAFVPGDDDVDYVFIESSISW
jgi:hypothetical protein